MDSVFGDDERKWYICLLKKEDMKIVIQGAGEIGSHLAKMLSKEANDITIIDDNPQRLQNITAIADVIAIEGHPSSHSCLRMSTS